MDRIPSPYHHSARKPGIVSKVFITLCSLVTIALLIFAGSRDWKSDKTASTTLSDTSDLRDLATDLLKAGVAKVNGEQASAPESKEQASLISHGTLLQRQTTDKSLPAGMATASAY
ncbi:hypothetical protein OVA24_12020 [Luteolibacter sp. SL250]|uniref:hypothetical protein n=1 Tax=Luteolibacter sp. SL250 TaxID=2995170 RepID=UPI00226ECCF8|nr:hypothetical protein [Luteolibacter sp. SL250]WAC17964.1 hypothetical protein OVA24_12020 [Luteolibacter sp. SL250]